MQSYLIVATNKDLLAVIPTDSIKYRDFQQLQRTDLETDHGLFIENFRKGKPYRNYTIEDVKFICIDQELLDLNIILN